jgi:hypothetical protein
LSAEIHPFLRSEDRYDTDDSKSVHSSTSSTGASQGSDICDEEEFLLPVAEGVEFRHRVYSRIVRQFGSSSKKFPLWARLMMPWRRSHHPILGEKSEPDPMLTRFKFIIGIACSSVCVLILIALIAL